PPRSLAPSTDRALEAVCLKAMARAPADRYPSPKALADDVERWLADEPVTAWREPLAVRAGRWVRRHRAAVGAIGLSLLTATTLLAVMVVLVGGEQGRTAGALGKAEESYEQARRAVEDSFVEVSQEILLDEPGFEPLRERLLRSALAYHQAFLRDRGGDPR